MKAGSHVDAIGQGGATPLHYAAGTSEKRMVRALLSWDANPDTRDHPGMTALDLAKDPVMVRYELNRKANDTARLTPLQRAAEDGDTGVVQLLLELGASINDKSRHGQTALMVVAKNGHPDVGELLVDAGANIDATDKCGRTAFDMSWTHGFSGLLRNLGATVAKTAVDGPIAEDDVEHAREGPNGATQVDRDVAPRVTAVGEQSGQIRSSPPRPQAALERDLGELQLLLVSGVDIEERDALGQTRLYIAAKNG